METDDKQLVSLVDVAGKTVVSSESVKPMTAEKRKQLMAQQELSEKEMTEQAKQRIRVLDGMRTILVDGKREQIDPENPEHVRLAYEQNAVRVQKNVNVADEEVDIRGLTFGDTMGWRGSVLIEYHRRLPPPPATIPSSFLHVGHEIIAEAMLTGILPYFVYTPFVMTVLDIASLRMHITAPRLYAYFKLYLEFLVEGHGAPTKDEQLHYEETGQILATECTQKEFETAVRRIHIGASVLSGGSVPDQVYATYSEDLRVCGRMLLWMIQNEAVPEENSEMAPKWFAEKMDIEFFRVPADLPQDVFENIVVYMRMLYHNREIKMLKRVKKQQMHENPANASTEFTQKILGLYHTSIWTVLSRCIADGVDIMGLQYYDPHNFVKRARGLQMAFIEEDRRFLPLSVREEGDFLHPLTLEEEKVYVSGLQKFFDIFEEPGDSTMGKLMHYYCADYPPKSVITNAHLLSSIMVELTEEHQMFKVVEESDHLVEAATNTMFLDEVEKNGATLFQPYKVEGISACEKCGKELCVFLKDGAERYKNGKFGSLGEIVCFECD